MVTDRKKDSDKTPVKQGSDKVSSEPNKITLVQDSIYSERLYQLAMS